MGGRESGNEGVAVVAWCMQAEDGMWRAGG